MKNKFIIVLMTMGWVLTVTTIGYAGENKGMAYYSFGVFAYDEGNYAEAEQYLKKAIELEPDNPYYKHFLGKTYMKTDRYSDAEKNFKSSLEINPEMIDVKYDLGLLYYKISEFSKAADRFISVSTEKPSNALAQYYAGMSLFKQEKYKRALEYFVNAGEKMPALSANSFFYAGICHAKLNEYDHAVEKFSYVRDRADTAFLKENAEKWIQGIELRKKMIKSYSVYFKAGYQYDSNVQLEPLDIDVYEDKDDDVIEIYFSGKYHLPALKRFNTGFGYDHYQTIHRTLSEYDLTGSIVNVYGKYTFNPFSVGITYSPTWYQVDFDRYLMRHQLKNEIMWKAGNRTTLKLSYTFNDNDYIQDDNRDGEAHEYFLDAYYSFTNKTVIAMSAGWEDNTADHSDYEYGQWSARLNLSWKVTGDIDFNIGGKYSDKQHDQVDSVYDTERNDKKYFGSITLSRKFLFEWLTITGEVNFTKNESNIDTYEYERFVTILSMTTKF